MKRTNIFSVKFRNHDDILNIARGCSAFWNVINYKRRQSFFNGEFDWSTSEEYKKFAPSIGSATAQQIIRKDNYAWQAFFSLLMQKIRLDLQATGRTGIGEKSFHEYSSAMTATA